MADEGPVIHGSSRPDILRQPAAEPADPGVPAELREGWQAFCEWRNAMARAGTPLPPGGVFLLNRATVTADALQILWAELAIELRMPPEAIRVNAEVKDGRLRPVIEVDIPDTWAARTFPDVRGVNRRKFAEDFVQGVITRAYERFGANLEDRLKALAAPTPPREVIDALALCQPRPDPVADRE
jgi:hypothetical protein